MPALCPKRWHAPIAALLAGHLPPAAAASRRASRTTRGTCSHCTWMPRCPTCRRRCSPVLRGWGGQPARRVMLLCRRAAAVRRGAALGSTAAGPVQPLSLAHTAGWPLPALPPCQVESWVKGQAQATLLGDSRSGFLHARVLTLFWGFADDVMISLRWGGPGGWPGRGAGLCYGAQRAACVLMA